VSKEKQKLPSDFIRYSGMAAKMAIVILAGVFGGQKLDYAQQNEKPIFTIIFSLASVAVAIYIVIRETQS
jgi:membrane protein DedA with SNARE-associated domain